MVHAHAAAAGAEAGLEEAGLEEAALEEADAGLEPVLCAELGDGLDDSHVVTANATITTAATAARIQNQAGIERQVGLAPSAAREPRRSFMGTSSRGINLHHECSGWTCRRLTPTALR